MRTLYILVMFLGIVGTRFKDGGTRDGQIQNKDIA